MLLAEPMLEQIERRLERLRGAERAHLDRLRPREVENLTDRRRDSINLLDDRVERALRAVLL